MENQIHTDILVIGGGAAGLMASCMAAKSGSEVIVLEKMPRPGRKIMITGKGRCNFTNVKTWSEFSTHVHPKPNLLKSAFMNLPPEKVIQFFEDAGLECVVEHGDRAYPASYRASDIVDALVKTAHKAGAKILCGREIEDVVTDRREGGCSFKVSCSNSEIYISNKLILATGGLSYPSTGSTGDGLKWAEKLGLELAPTFPTLTALVPRGYKSVEAKPGANPSEKKPMKGHLDRGIPLSETGNLLCGQSLKNVGLSLIIDGAVVQEEFGDLDFTDGGLEGALGFRLSRRCVKAILNGSKAALVMDLKPAVSLQALENRVRQLWDEICQDRRSRGRSYADKFKVLLAKLLPKDFIPGFVRCNPDVDHQKLARRLKSWKMEVEGYVGYERCVATAGGVKDGEVTAKTLESRKVPGLYFAGEILDLDGDTGGYNLQIAWATGALSGLSAAKSGAAPR